MNMKKTKVMFGNKFFWGQKIGAFPDHEKEIKKNRNGIEWNAFDREDNIMKSYLPLSLKRKVYNQCIPPILTYGSETWIVTKNLERKL